MPAISDGTVIDERITLATGGEAGARMPRSEIKHLIREVQRVPVERGTVYRELSAPLEIRRASWKNA